MKKTFALLLLSLTSLSALADIVGCRVYENNDKSNDCYKCHEGYDKKDGICVDRDLSAAGTDACDKKVEGNAEARLRASQAGTVLAMTPCENFYYASKIANSPMGAKDMRSSPDRVITCVQKAGYTLDYDPCESALKMYNNVLTAEKVMQAQQAVRQTINNKKVQSEANKQMAAGNGQTAAYNATIETSNSLARMNQEQVAVYTAAVSALSYKLLNWNPPTAGAFKKLCDKNPTAVNALAAQGYPKDCSAVLFAAWGQSKKVVYANDVAKASLIAALTEFTSKGITAGMNSKILEKQADDLQNMVSSQEDQESLLDKCVTTPNDPKCKGARVANSAYQGGTFDVGGAPGNNEFAFGGEEGAAFGDPGNATTLGDGGIAGVASPFAEQAKEASGILNPAAAATTSPGGGAAGGGGGGGGGVGGGGGASLGSDLAGADKADKKETEIKTTKLSGNYASSGGGGFQGVKGDKDDANPLAGLFDSKSNGGIEEERGIASEGIDGEASGLFQKISNKYGQMQAEKRIEANNLE